MLGYKYYLPSSLSIGRELRNVRNPEDSSGALGDRKHYTVLFEKLQSGGLQKWEDVQISEAL